MRKENKYHLFWRTLFILFVFYVAIFISVENGYYEKQNAKKTIITEEKMKEFEEDVRNNEDVDIKDYLVEEYKDYSSPTSKLAVNLSTGMEKVMNKCINSTVSLLKKLFT